MRLHTDWVESDDQAARGLSEIGRSIARNKIVDTISVASKTIGSANQYTAEP